MQNAVSRQKQLITVSGVANAQKQGVAEVECIEASDTTMFQELVQNAECRMQNAVSRQKQLITVSAVANAQKQGERKKNS